jgi:hypothetical protein
LLISSKDQIALVFSFSSFLSGVLDEILWLLVILLCQGWIHFIAGVLGLVRHGRSFIALSGQMRNHELLEFILFVILKKKTLFSLRFPWSSEFPWTCVEDLFGTSSLGSRKGSLKVWEHLEAICSSFGFLDFASGCSCSSSACVSYRLVRYHRLVWCASSACPVRAQWLGSAGSAHRWSI